MHMILLWYDGLCRAQVRTLVMTSSHTAVINTERVHSSPVLWSVMYSKRSEAQAPPSVGRTGSLQPPTRVPPCSSSAVVVSVAADRQDVTSRGTECVYREPAGSV